MLARQWFCYGIFGTPRDMDVGLVLTFLANAGVVEVDLDAELDSDWFPYTFGEEMISVLPASASLRRVSASSEQIEEEGMSCL